MAGELPDDMRLQDLFDEMDDLIGKDDMDVDVEEMGGDLGARLRDLLAKKKGPAPSSSAVSSNSVSESSSYSIIKIQALKRLQIPSLCGGVSVTADKIGSFRDSANSTGFSERNLYAKKKNVQFSFDPASMTCLSCYSKHGVLMGGGRGGMQGVSFL
jgi:hypothetical protein